MSKFSFKIRQILFFCFAKGKVTELSEGIFKIFGKPVKYEYFDICQRMKNTFKYF